jgi:RNA polymerase sigma-70 factor (ECF subfamily)
LASDKELADFLKSAEKRAFKRVVYAVRDDDAALDIVQDSMIRLAEKYVDRPAAELPLLFQRILSNATMDWFRRQKVRNAHVRNFSDFESSDDSGDGDFNILDALEALDGAHSGTESAADSVSRAQILLLIDEQIQQLPGRQREAFLLRYWEELDVAETAQVMGCSEGSVKTHCSRAVHALAKALQAKGIAP